MSFKSPKVDSELIQSLSDDQLYRGARRASIYTTPPKVKVLSEIRTSMGRPIIRRKMIEFEGDGPLGIVFTNKNEQMSIKSIMKGSVSSEYYELSIDMSVIQINDISINGLGYVKSMEILGQLWRKNSKVTLHFEYENHNDLIDNPVESPIYKFLDELNCSDFYASFIELGAVRLDDLKFIESSDLVKMKVPSIQIRLIQLAIGELSKDELSKDELSKDDLSKDELSKDISHHRSEITISFHIDMNNKDRSKELERLKSIHGQNYIVVDGDTDLELIADDV